MKNILTPLGSVVAWFLLVAGIGIVLAFIVVGCTSTPCDWPWPSGADSDSPFVDDQPIPLLALSGDWEYRSGRWQREGEDYWIAVVWSTCEKLRAHESLNGTRMVGDGGLARGWLHQHEDHWREGCAFMGVDWPWPEDTDDYAKCRHVALAYWFVHARPWLMAANQSELVRRFRLPYAPYRECNDVYVKKVLNRKD